MCEVGVEGPKNENESSRENQRVLEVQAGVHTRVKMSWNYEQKSVEVHVKLRMGIQGPGNGGHNSHQSQRVLKL